MTDMPLKILIIEDNPGDVRLIREALEETGAGFILEHAECLEAGLEALSREGVDAVLLDLNLPDSRGLDTLEEVVGRAPHVPVVVLTVIGDEDVAVEAVKRGAQDYLVKEADGDDKLVARSLRYAVERKRAEEALRESEEKYRGLVEGLDEAIYRMSLPDGRYEYLSPASLGIFGYSSRDFLDNPLLIKEIMHPDFADYFREKWTDLIEGRVPPIYEYKIIDPEGNERWIIQSNRGIFDNEGKIIAIEGLCRDVTERKRAEEALRGSEERLRAIADTARDAIIVIDDKGKASFWNPAAEEMFGYSRREAIGRELHTLIAPERHQEAFMKGFAAFRKTGKGPAIGKTLELEAVRKDRMEFLVELSLSAMQIEGKWHAVGIIRDITERKEAEEELRIRSGEMEAYARSVSHDLRGPLSLILGFAQTAIRAREAGKEELEKESLEDIVRSARRMNEFIESLLQYARAGSPQGKVARVEPGKVMREVLSDLGKDIHEEGIEVEVMDDLPAIRVDPMKLTQVLSNLAANAVKFMGDIPHPRIEIGAEREGDLVTMYVCDNGAGIPEQEQEGVFEPFKSFRIEGPPGLGIGLSTVKKAVEAWGGKVWVESAPGKGATFFFTAPAA